jgi:CelD/BcsL family acetyltransferase involved in cellulose biosynthesis
MENVGYNMNTPNLRRILEIMTGEEENAALTKEEKRQFMQDVANFSALGESVYGSGKLKDMTERVRDIVDKAQRIMTEDKDWFDNVTVSRHAKGLTDAYKVFESTAREVNQLQQRLEAAYEDIGTHLGKYYEVG